MPGLCKDGSSEANIFGLSIPKLMPVNFSAVVLVCYKHLVISKWIKTHHGPFTSSTPGENGSFGGNLAQNYNKTREHYKFKL